MSQFANLLQGYRYQEQQILEQLKSSKVQTSPAGVEINKSIIGEVGAIAAGELFGRRSVGRRIGRALVDQQQKQNAVVVEQRIETLHRETVASVTQFLTTVSQQTSRLTVPNSHRLVSQIAQAQKFTKLETRITKTIAVLQSLESMPLVSNESIPKSIDSASSSILRNLPRIAAIRGMLPEVEPKLRRFIRSELKGLSGLTWETRLSQKFSKEFPKWQEKAAKRSGQDALDGQTLGELVHTIEAIPELKRALSGKPEVTLALGILSSSRPIFMHPLESQVRDIDIDSYRRIELAIHTIVEAVQ